VNSDGGRRRAETAVFHRGIVCVFESAPGLESVNMSVRVGINGFGRIGRLTLRAGLDRPEFTVVHINEAEGGAVTAAHLLEFDSVHGRWPVQISAGGGLLTVCSTLRLPTAFSKSSDRPRLRRSTGSSKTRLAVHSKEFSGSRSGRWSRSIL